MLSRTLAALAVSFFVSTSASAGAIIPGFDTYTPEWPGGVYFYDSPLKDNVGYIGFDVTPSRILENYGSYDYLSFLSSRGELQLEKLLTPSSWLFYSFRPFFNLYDLEYNWSYPGATAESYGTVSYGMGTYDGRAAFGVNWLDTAPPDDFIGINGITGSERNSFQVIIVDRSDTGVGNFDFIYNYDSIQWDNGSSEVSFNTFGLERRSYELPGSGVSGYFLDGSPTALVSNSWNSDVAGRYVFEMRDGVVTNFPAIPEPETWAMLLVGLGVVSGIARRRRAKH